MSQQPWPYIPSPRGLLVIAEEAAYLVGLLGDGRPPGYGEGDVPAPAPEAPPLVLPEADASEAPAPRGMIEPLEDPAPLDEIRDAYEQDIKRGLSQINVVIRAGQRVQDNGNVRLELLWSGWAAQTLRGLNLLRKVLDRYVVEWGVSFHAIDDRPGYPQFVRRAHPALPMVATDADRASIVWAVTQLGPDLEVARALLSRKADDATTAPTPDDWILASQAEIAWAIGRSTNTARLLATLQEKNRIVYEAIGRAQNRVLFTDPQEHARMKTLFEKKREDERRRIP